MSSFTCQICKTDIIDSEIGYVTGCDHYPIDKRPTVEKVSEVLAEYQKMFPNDKLTITTDDPDPAKNLENAKLFGKAGVKGKWVHKDEK